MQEPEIPSVDVWDCLFERKEKPFPDDHVIFKLPSSGEIRTYNDIRSRALRFGANLQTQWHWQKDDVLLFFSPNALDVPTLYWGCHWAGGIVSPANPTYTVEELEFQLENSGAKGLVVHASLLDIAVAAAKRVNIPVARILAIGTHSGALGVQHVDTMLAGTTADISRPEINPVTDTAFLVYSSGTTGRPKGAMVTHSNIVASLTLQRHIEQQHLDHTKDKILALLPTYHIFGLVALVHIPLFMGLHTTILEKFSVNAFLDNVQNEGITHVYVAPPVVLYLAKDRAMTRERLSSLRMVTSGGAPLAPDLIRAVYDRLKVPVRQAFGLTESTAPSHIQRWDQWHQGIGSNGPPLPRVEVMFIDENDRPIKTGEGLTEGQLCLRGPNIFPGYHKNAEATARSFTSDGWFKSGDIGYQDAQGNMFITDRLKDLIKYKGYQIPPAEIEGVLHENPLVHDVAVIGVPVHKIASEVPVAYVVLGSTDKPVDHVAKELVAHVSERLAPHKRLRGGIILIDEIPKSPSGKILKRVLRDRAAGVDQGKALGATIYEDRSSKL